MKGIGGSFVSPDVRDTSECRDLGGFSRWDILL